MPFNRKTMSVSIGYNAVYDLNGKLCAAPLGHQLDFLLLSCLVLYLYSKKQVPYSWIWGLNNLTGGTNNSDETQSIEYICIHL